MEDNKQDTVTEPTASINPIYRDIDKLDPKKANDSTAIASGVDTDINKYVEDIDNIDTDGADIQDMFNEEELVNIAVNYDTSTKTFNNDMLANGINSEEFTPDNSNSNKLGINTVDIKATGNLKGGDAVAKFTSMVSVGKYTSVTLWHSGFTITIKPPKDSDIINLQHKLAKLEYKLGTETHNFAYSNYGVIVNKILTEFVIAHIVTSSLALPSDKEYIDFIKITDLNSLAIGIAAARRPNGYLMHSTCKNSLIIENSRPLCDFTASGRIVPSELIWVNRGALTTEQLTHISKVTHGSQTPEEVLTYQDSLVANKEKEILVGMEDSPSLIFKVQTPNLRKHIDSGELWVNNIIKHVEGLVTDPSSDEDKESAINSLIKSSLLNKYNPYVNSITMGDTATDDLSAITGILEEFSSEENISNALLNGIIDYINTGYISLAATYNYDCPKCKAEGRDSDQGGSSIEGFKEFIPLNAVEHFFDLSTLMFTEIVRRTA